jgi:hypothetical protein
LNACLSVGGCEERVQKPLAAHGELLQPGEELSGRGVVSKDANHFPSRPPWLDKLSGCDHIERLGETAGIGDDMNELSKNLGAIAMNSPAASSRDRVSRAAMWSVCSFISAATRKPVSVHES